MKNKIASYVENDSVFIKIPLDLLKFAQETHPSHPCKIYDENKMGEWFSKNILEYGEDENIGSKFYELIDEMFEDAMEYGQEEEWLESLDWEAQ